MKKAILLLPAVCAICVMCGWSSKPNEKDKKIEALNAKKIEQAQADADNAITKQITNAIKNDEYLSRVAKKMNVSSQNGIVTLDGKVKSNKERKQLIKIARNIPGVKKVVDQMVLS